MKLKKLIRLVAFVLLFALTTLAFPLCTLASDNIPMVVVSESVNDNIPPASEISQFANYATGFSSAQSSAIGIMAESSNTVSGGCSFSKLSSTSVATRGYSICTEWVDAISVATTLQAYYSGAWHNMHTAIRSVSGTYVSNTQQYTVTPGYYYRTCATHWATDGSSTSSKTAAIWVA